MCKRAFKILEFPRGNEIRWRNCISAVYMDIFVTKFAQKMAGYRELIPGFACSNVMWRHFEWTCVSFRTLLTEQSVSASRESSGLPISYQRVASKFFAERFSHSRERELVRICASVQFNVTTRVIDQRSRQTALNGLRNRLVTSRAKLLAQLPHLRLFLIRGRRHLLLSAHDSWQLPASRQDRLSCRQLLSWQDVSRECLLARLGPSAICCLGRGRKWFLPYRPSFSLSASVSYLFISVPPTSSPHPTPVAWKRQTATDRRRKHWFPWAPCSIWAACELEPVGITSSA